MFWNPMNHNAHSITAVILHKMESGLYDLQLLFGAPVHVMKEGILILLEWSLAVKIQTAIARAG